MTLEFWYREDVRNILAGLLLALHDLSVEGKAEPAYVRGYQDALRSAGATFGIVLPRVIETEGKR